MKNRKNLLGIITFMAVIVSMFTFTACATGSNMAKNVTLDQTILQAAESMGANFNSGIKIAMLNFTSASLAFSEYVLDELGGALVNTKKVSVVDRRELDLIRQEENFQLSGEASDESMVSIGKKLGAQMIVTGSLRDMGTEYRFTARTLNVETAQVEAFFSSDIPKKEKRTTYLLSVRNPPPPRAPSPQKPTAENPYRPLSGFQNATVIGIVQTNFQDSSGDWNFSSINERAYSALLASAREEHSGIIDIVDITWVYDNPSRSGGYYNYSASGKVVKLE